MSLLHPLKCYFIGLNWMQNFTEAGHFDIYKFEFEKYLRKEKNRIFENSSII